MCAALNLNKPGTLEKTQEGKLADPRLLLWGKVKAKVVREMGILHCGSHLFQGQCIGTRVCGGPVKKRNLCS